MTRVQLADPRSSVPAGTVDTLFSRIMLAIDFGSASLGAARWATTYIASGGEAVLMHVAPCDDDVGRADGDHQHGDESIRGMTPALAGGLGGFAATLGVRAARNIVRIGRPSSCLAAVTNDVEAPLLVLGRRIAANRIGIGEPNVIERVARRTNASVLVVPEGTTRAPEHVVAAVDESPFGPLALRAASRLARLHEIPLTVLHVLSPVVGAYERVIRSAKKLLASNERPTHGAGASHVRVSPNKAQWLVNLERTHSVLGRDSTAIAMGDPAREIARAATERDAALVVVGMRGSDGAPVGSIGSVVRELLTRAPVPVLAVNGI
jgi:nucleotide-binding universal stress UspA family protein